MIDATCGNGHDTLMLCRLALKNDCGQVYAIDIQPGAIAKAKQLLAGQLPFEQLQKVHFIEGSHLQMPGT